MPVKLLTVPEAAQMKGVSRSAIYGAITDGRLPAVRVLGRLALKEADVQAWQPVKYANRPGRKGGRPKGIPVNPETKERISQSQKNRWARRKRG